MVAKLYENGKAVSTATFFELDDVIDPAETRTWISMALKSAPEPAARQGRNVQWLTLGKDLYLLGDFRIRSALPIRVTQLPQVQLFGRRRNQDIR